jgi:hypothetical protein
MLTNFWTGRLPGTLTGSSKIRKLIIVNRPSISHQRCQVPELSVPRFAFDCCRILDDRHHIHEARMMLPDPVQAADDSGIGEANAARAHPRSGDVFRASGGDRGRNLAAPQVGVQYNTSYQAASWFTLETTNVYGGDVRSPNQIRDLARRVTEFLALSRRRQAAKGGDRRADIAGCWVK